MSARAARALGRSGDEAGYGLVELLVSTVLTLLVVGSLGQLLVTVQEHQHDLQANLDAQQGARLALVRIQRDLQMAGVGLARLQPPFPYIIPRADGVEIRVNGDQATTFLIGNMGNSTQPLNVDSVEGFEVGDVIAVYDTTGDLDLTTVTDVQGNHLNHTGVSKPYSKFDGTTIAQIATIVYRLEGVAAPFQLVREVDGADTAVIAGNVYDFELVYWDDSDPRGAFTPTTAEEQLRIEMIQVLLEVGAPEPRLRDGVVPTTRFEARVAPRALVMF